MAILLPNCGRSSAWSVALGLLALLMISGPVDADTSRDGTAAGDRPAVSAHGQPKGHKAARVRGKRRLANAAAPQPSAVANRPALIAPGRAGMVVGIDPASGEPGPPTDEQLQAMQADPNIVLDRSTDGLVVITRPDGSQHVNLKGRFRSYSVLSLDTDGTPRVDCVESRAQALTLVGAGASHASPKPEPAPRAVVGPREE